MVMKYKIAKLEDVPEAQRGEYAADPAGGFVLSVEGAVAKERLDEFRNNNILLQQQIDKFKDVDPAKYKELMVLQRKIQEKELIEKGEVDKVVELRVTAMREELTGKITEYEKTIETNSRQLSHLLIDNVVKGASIKAGVVPTAVDDVVLRAATVFKIENGAPVAKDAGGNVVYAKDGTTPLSVEAWVTELKKIAPHLFQGAQGSGASGGGRQSGADTSKMSPVEKITAGLTAQSLLGNLPGA